MEKNNNKSTDTDFVRYFLTVVDVKLFIQKFYFHSFTTTTSFTHFFQNGHAYNPTFVITGIRAMVTGLAVAWAAAVSTTIAVASASASTMAGTRL